MVMVAKVGDELLFARTVLAAWSTDSSRIGLEINRSLFYAEQQFGYAVERVWLLGQNNSATASVKARCGERRQITVLPTVHVEWLQSSAKLSPRQPINLVAAHLRRKSLRRSIRNVLLAVCWSGLALLIVDASTSARAWSEEQRQISELRTQVPAMKAERNRLLALNETVRREREFIRQVDDERLPPVAGTFAAYLAGILPPEVRLTDLAVKWETGARGWSFRLEGFVEADEATSQEIFADRGGRLVVAARHLPGAAAPLTHRFSLEGVMLEN